MAWLALQAVLGLAMLLASAGLPMAICLVVLMLAPLVRLSAAKLWGIDISTPR